MEIRLEDESLLAVAPAALRSYWMETGVNVCDSLIEFVKQECVGPAALSPADKEPYVCDVCELKCALSVDLCVHMRTHRVINLTYSHPCLYCNREFPYNSDLTSHILSTHTNEKSYYCQCCGYEGSYKSVANHVTGVHSMGKYVCKYCGYKNSYESVAKHIQRVHTGGKYSCKYCNFKCKHRVTLNRHMATRPKEPYVCDICNRKFHFNIDFCIHMRAHSDDHCQTGSRNCSDLLRGAQRPYSCKYCYSKFLCKRHLYLHIKTHISKKFSCKYCYLKFSTRGFFKRHLKLKHQQETTL